MKKIILIGYILAIIWGSSELTNISTTYSSQIQGQSQSYILGSLLAVILLTITPLAIVISYHVISNHNSKKPQESKHAI